MTEENVSEITRADAAAVNMLEHLPRLRDLWLNALMAKRSEVEALVRAVALRGDKQARVLHCMSMQPYLFLYTREARAPVPLRELVDVATVTSPDAFVQCLRIGLSQGRPLSWCLASVDDCSLVLQQEQKSGPDVHYTTHTY